MTNFFAELKRRNVYRVGALYAVVAWVLLQFTANVAPILDLPPWIARTVLLLLVIGFPVALIFAWVHQLSPEGGTARAATSKLDWALMGALIVVIVLVSYQQLAPVSGEQAAQVQQVASAAAGAAAAGQQASVALARSAALNSGSAISVAVLPFVNLSSDKEQEFFSDGMTEEITSALAKVKGLNVVARTSAFEFKGQNKDVRTIAHALSATHLIEGSVRKAGTRVRITAQLIRADTGAHLWTDSYDRELKDIFATQEDIAQAIAGALQLPLGLKPGETLVSNRTIDPETYQDYLRARAQFRARSLDYGVALLEGIINRDQDYAPAWALLSFAYILNTGNNDPASHGGNIEEAHRVYAAARNKAERAAREAIRLDIKSALAYSRLATFRMDDGKWAEAEDFFRQALALDATDSDVLDNYGRFLAKTGRVKEALRTRDQLRILEPYVPIYNDITAEILQIDGQTQAAVQILQATADPNARVRLARAYAQESRYAEAADTLLSSPQTRIPRRMIEDAARLLRTAPRMAETPEKLPVLWDLWFVYAHIGAFDRVMQAEETNWAIPRDGQIYFMWEPEVAPLRKTERFKALVRKMGLVDYWRARSWPDHCRPMGADDFACD